MVLIVICGATASGKSELAMSLAQRLDIPIISADSRQVYREFDIGTAKPTKQEQELVKHHLIDICEPTETLTLAEYQEQAQQLIDNSSIAMLVGGTGLYIKSITRGLKIPRVSPQTDLRSQLMGLGQTQLYGFLAQVDPIAATKIHANDQVRTLRALEVFYVTGKTISSQQGEKPPSYPILQIGLNCEPDILDSRIKLRTNKMVELGLVKEVESLCNKYGVDFPLLNTLGYAEFKQYILGNISLDMAISDTVLHTRQFAKRQRTWFRGNDAITWFNADSPTLIDDVWQFLQPNIS
ncbi:MAG: tRNA (adenosine(37)-N6)-dimethylallyltransferase MiaA [Xenococcaceae cyanobacterium MO_188.B19]|nr:tRNA (adenosine(37)-N6)-dimethylallyltransferase MiaA [Xenococcaceae cyanobacterium MO_188.B19]